LELNGADVKSSVYPFLVIVPSVISFVISFGRPIVLARTLPTTVTFRGTPFESREALLADKEATRLFREYLVKCACEENLDFLRDVSEYEGINEERELQRKFTEIVEVYFGNRATRINVSGAKINQIAQMRREECDHHTFRAIAAEIFELLRGQYFQKAARTEKLGEHLREIEERRDVVRELTVSTA
jgi:hypothetical protein